MSTNEHARYPERKIHFDHGSDRDYLPLQAADRSRERNVPLHAEQIPECGDRKDACPFLGATPIGDPDEHARHIIEALKPNCMFMVPLYNKGALEIIFDGRASGAIRPDGFNVEAIRR